VRTLPSVGNPSTRDLITSEIFYAERARRGRRFRAELGETLVLMGAGSVGD